MSFRKGPLMVRLVSSLALAFLLVTVLAMPSAFAADDVISIFDVRKTLPLDPSDPVFYDYYVNAGPEAGLKKGMFVSVVRRMPIHDPVQNKAQASLSVEVAKVQIIHVERNIGVARLVADFGSEDRPVLEYEGVMIGDILDLTTVSMDAPKQKRRKRGPSSQEATAATSVPAPPSTGTILIPVGPSAPSLVPPPGAQPATPKASEGPSVESPAAETPPTTVENPSPAPPVPDMVRPGDDNFHT